MFVEFIYIYEQYNREIYIDKGCQKSVLFRDLIIFKAAAMSGATHHIDKG